MKRQTRSTLHFSRLFALLAIWSMTVMACSSDVSGTIQGQDTQQSVDADTTSMDVAADDDAQVDLNVSPGDARVDVDADESRDMLPEDGGSDLNPLDGSTPDGGSEVVSICRVECETVADCPTPGPKSQRVCDDGLCRQYECSEDIDCVARYSTFFTKGCKSGECNPGFVCIEYEDTTYCAPGSTSSCFDGFTLQELQRVDGNGVVEACVNEQTTCNDRQCTPKVGCENNDDCSDDLVCSDSGKCICETDAQCPAVTGHDKCINGNCSCSGTASCARNNGFFTFACVPL